MSGAERCYRIALLAFPKAYRRERGEEIVATILEGGDGRSPRLRELRSLVWAGITQRSLAAAGATTPGSIRAGVRLGAFSLYWLGAVYLTALAFQPCFTRVQGGYREYLYGILGALAALCGIAALARGWWAAPFIFAVWNQLANYLFLLPGSPRWPWDFAGASTWEDAQIIVRWAILFFLTVLLLALARPRRDEPRDLRSWLWTPAALLIGLLISSQGLFYTSWLGRPLAVVLAVWLLLAWRDLRLAVAGATVTTFIGASLIFNAFTWATPAMTWTWTAHTDVVRASVFLLMAALAIAVGVTGRRVSARL
ncbi:MAG: hypothetical protein ABSC51_03530 [Gaiellaceae bacterium]|jgi:hypothetical protein